MVGPFKESTSWLSAYELSRAPLMRFDGDVVRIGSAACGRAVPITIVVIVDCLEQYNTLTSLANVEYDAHEVVFVFRTPEIYTQLASWIRSYDRVIPIRGVFKPESELSIDDAILAGLQSAPAPYVCFMFNADMVHKKAFARASTVLAQGNTDCYMAIGFQMNKHIWATPYEQPRPDNQLMIVRKQAAIMTAAKKLSASDHPYARLWMFADAAKDATVVRSELAYFRADRNFDEAITQMAYDKYKGRGETDGEGTGDHVGVLRQSRRDEVRAEDCRSLRGAQQHSGEDPDRG